MGSQKHSQASKNRWKNVSPKERTTRMKLLAKLRWSKVLPKDRREYSLKMLKAKNEKR